MMDLPKLEIKKNSTKPEDKNLSFRVFELDALQLKAYRQPHKKDHFCIILVTDGKIEVHIEDKIHFLKSGKISIIFPDQIHFVATNSDNLKGKIILFEEVLFCSDILRNDLSAYNVNFA